MKINKRYSAACLFYWYIYISINTRVTKLSKNKKSITIAKSILYTTSVLKKISRKLSKNWNPKRNEKVSVYISPRLFRVTYLLRRSFSYSFFSFIIVIQLLYSGQKSIIKKYFNRLVQKKKTFTFKRNYTLYVYNYRDKCIYFRRDSKTCFFISCQTIHCN